MSHAHILTTTLWLLPVVLQIAVAVTMVRRKMLRTFPFFFFYSVFVPSRDVALFFLPYQSNRYSLVYWWGDAVAVALGLGVVFETLPHIFSSSPFLRRILGPVWITALVAAVTALLLWVATPVNLGDRGFDWVLLLERSARFLQVCILLVVMMLMTRLGATWDRYAIGILSGFGVYSAIDLAAVELRGHLHFVTDGTFVLVNPAAYNLACLVWAFTLLRPPLRGKVDELPNTGLAEWHEVVSESISQWRRRF